MKKLFTLITLFAGTVAAMGTDYTDKLVVNINNTATVPVTTTISVEAVSYTHLTLPTTSRV